MGQRPDPASVYWDAAAAAFLDRVLEARGRWYAGRITDPPPELLEALGQLGYDPFGPDNKSGRGPLNARDAWRRAFVRAVYRANDPRNGGPGRSIQLEVGRKMPRRGTQPPYRPVRGRVRRGGKAAAAAARRLPEAQQWAYGGPGASQVGRRDWVGQ